MKPARALATILCLAPCLLPATAAPWADISGESGLDFVHFNGMSGELYLPEMMGAGAALFDYDNDGDLDLYLVQGAMLGPGKTLEDAVLPPPHPPPFGDRLYRNDLSGTAVHFVDVTAEAGIEARGYGMGVAAGDINNDGWVDLYVTNFGSNQLWMNNGDGTFSDRTDAAGVDDPRWSVSASFLDYDRDGWLDLYVGNYLDFSFDQHRVCGGDYPDYCSPLRWNSVPDRLFRNRGDGGFDDVTRDSGIGAMYGSALGTIAADFDMDGHLDVFVANDSVLNILWINRGGRRFSNTALMAGVAVNADGHPEASMGVDAADHDADGDLDLFVSHLTGESSTLYVNDGTGRFQDASSRLGLAATTMPWTGFGTAWLDDDNDGWLDILTVNGAVLLVPTQRDAGSPHPLAQPDQLLRNTGGRYRHERAGVAALERPGVSRGAAFGDFDNDGDTDVVISDNGAAARVLRNDRDTAHHWLGLRLRVGPRDALGAWLVARTPDLPLVRRVGSDGSYASARDPRVIVGLGRSAAAVSVEVHWVDGAVESWPALAPDRYHVLEQGAGTPAEPVP